MEKTLTTHKQLNAMQLQKCAANAHNSSKKNEMQVAHVTM